MINKILALVLMIAIVCGCSADVFASQQSDNTSDVAGEVPVYTLSLAQAVEMAKKSSPDLECCDVNKENIRVQLKNARITQKNNKNTEVYASVNYDLVFVKKGYYVEMFTKQYDLADYEKAKVESSIAYDVTQKYYNCKNAVAMYNSAQSALERAIENETIVQMRLSLGMCTKLDADSVSLAVSQCRANLEKCANNIEIANEALKIVLGINGECILNLTDELTAEPFSANLSEDIAGALKSRYDVNALRVSAELAAFYYSIVESLDDENTTYYSAYTNHIKAEYDYSTGVKNISLLIKSSYHSALDAINQAELAEKKLVLMKTEYEAYKIKNEIGMITNLTLSTKADELTECENAYNNALLARKLAIQKYGFDITTGV